MPTLIKAKGLGTYHNELGLPEGSLLTADNIVIDRNDVIESRRGLQNYGTEAPCSGSYNQLITYKERVLAHDGSKMFFDCCCTVGCFTAFSGCFCALESGLRIKSVESSSNLYFTTTDGIQKISGTLTPCDCCASLCVTNFSVAANFIVPAGGPKALDTTGLLTFACGAFLPPLSKTAYRIVWGIKDNNKNLILGSPSSRFLISNTDETKFVREVSCVTTIAACTACFDIGDYFLICDGSCTGYFVWYSDASCPVAPATSQTIGRTSVPVTHGASDTANVMAALTATALEAFCTVFCVSVACAVVTITNKTGGNVCDTVDGANTTAFTFCTSTQGSTCLGTSSNVCLTFSVPSDVNTTCFFYQVYRSRVVTATCICCVPCLEPGDEMNLVIENSITSCDLSAGTISVQDTTIDCFRESGVLLYTNPVSGEGILQANEKPPIAKDIAIFRETIFFSNTQTIQRKQFNFLAVSCFTSGCSTIVVGNCCSAREYTFVGAKEKTTITAIANTTDVNCVPEECVTFACDSYTETSHGLSTGNIGRWTLIKGCPSTTPSTCLCITACRITITEACHGYTKGERGQFTNDQCPDDLPAGLVLCTDYFVTNVTACTYQISATRAQSLICFAGVNVTDAGTGCTTFTPNGALPTGLFEGIDYYVIKCSCCVFKVATTGANATACPVVPVCISDIGSGCFVFTSCVLNGKYFLINSASNEKKYFFWFESTPCITVPSGSDTTGRIPIKIGLSAGEAATSVATKLEAQIGAQSDFASVICCPCTTKIIVCTIKNGNVADVADGIFTTAFTFAVTCQGDGEAPNACNALGGDILLSSLLSPAQSIDETARSLVNIINRDTCGITNAFYLSGEDDLPGIILLEGRNLSDPEFFIGVCDACIANKFNPKLPCAKTITGTAVCGATKTIVTAAAHGFNVNDDVYLYKTACCVALLGKHTITAKTTCTFTVTQPFVSTTTGRVYKADEESDNEVKPNRIYFSKSCIPESVPLVNFLDVGRQDSAIRRILALRDNLFIMKDDGVYILTGQCANFTVRLLGSSTNIIAPDSAAVLNNQIFMLSTQGVTSVSDTGIGVVSRSIEDKILDVASGPCFSTSSAAFGVGYESDRSYILWLPTTSNDSVATQAFRYNTFNKSWVRWTIEARAGLINPVDDKIYISSGCSSFIRKERKTGDRTDFADEQFCLSIPCQTICACVDKLTLSTVTCIENGDVLVQTQFLTIAKFNRLLRKLDLDTSGCISTDYFSTQELKTGECSGQALIDLVAKATADGIGAGETHGISTVCNTFFVGTNRGFENGMRMRFNKICASCSPTTCPAGLLDCCDIVFIVCVSTSTTKMSTARGGCPICITVASCCAFSYRLTPTFATPATAPSTFAVIRTDHNEFITCLNSHGSVCINDYKTISACCDVEQEVIIIGKCSSTNSICLGFSMPMLAGNIIHYKGIKAVVEYAPQHFGDPSVVKQIPEGTIVFDGNNFFAAKIGYSTDLSKDFTCFEFNGRGPGFFGGFDFECTAFGGCGTDVPYRNLIPRNKQRCRYITAKFTHVIAREDFSILGISYKVRPLSERGYRGI